MFLLTLNPKSNEALEKQEEEYKLKYSYKFKSLNKTIDLLNTIILDLKSNNEDFINGM